MLYEVVKWLKAIVLYFQCLLVVAGLQAGDFCACLQTEEGKRPERLTR